MSEALLVGSIYQHRKGGLYKVIAVAKVEATLEDVVVYQASYNGQIWTRPLAEFCDGRFKRVGTDGRAVT